MDIELEIASEFPARMASMSISRVGRLFSDTVFPMSGLGNEGKSPLGKSKFRVSQIDGRPGYLARILRSYTITNIVRGRSCRISDAPLEKDKKEGRPLSLLLASHWHVQTSRTN